MKKMISVILPVAMLLSVCCVFAGCGGDDGSFTVGICQLMVHDALDSATQGFRDALTEELGAENLEFLEQNANGEPTVCTTIVNDFVTKNVDLIMANATAALQAAANGTSTFPVLGTSVTDYADTFNSNIPANVSGTSDAVPFDEQAKMMIETLNLVAGDKVGVL